MAIVFNPFTSNFDMVDDNGGATSIGTNGSFILGDWTLVGQIYELEVVHMLETSQPVVTLYEGVNQVLADIEVLTTNSIKVKVSSNPDGRFAGNISLIKP